MSVLPCIVCGRELDSAIGDLEVTNQPYLATTFMAKGQYGSTVFDPFNNREYLEVNICDPCLVEKGKAGIVIYTVRDDKPSTWENKLWKDHDDLDEAERYVLDCLESESQRREDGPVQQSVTDDRSVALEQKIDGLTHEVKKLQRDRNDLKDEVALSETIISLKKRVQELEIQEERIKECHERERREVEHAVGLDRQRSEFETEQARREAVLSVREEALESTVKALEEKLDFATQSQKEQIDYLKGDIINVLVQALPNVNVELSRELGAPAPSRSRAKAS